MKKHTLAVIGILMPVIILGGLACAQQIKFSANYPDVNAVSIVSSTSEGETMFDMSPVKSEVTSSWKDITLRLGKPEILTDEDLYSEYPTTSAIDTMQVEGRRVKYALVPLTAKNSGTDDKTIYLSEIQMEVDAVSMFQEPMVYNWVNDATFEFAVPGGGEAETLLVYEMGDEVFTNEQWETLSTKEFRFVIFSYPNKYVLEYGR